MMEYIREWIRNLLIDLGVIAVIIFFMVVFMKLFYPDALSLIILSGQFTIGMIHVLKLWPLVLLAAIVYAMPRRRRINSRTR
jgi:hypothetical protein